MTDAPGHGPASSHDDHDDHDDHDAPEEDVVRTPLWLTAVGVALLLLGSLSTYMFVYPGRFAASSTTAGDGGGADASANPAPPPAPSAAPSVGTPQGTLPGPNGTRIQVVPRIVEPGAAH